MNERTHCESCQIKLTEKNGIKNGRAKADGTYSFRKYCKHCYNLNRNKTRGRIDIVPTKDQAVKRAIEAQSNFTLATIW